MNISWNNIRPIEHSQKEGFEELVCQLARREKILNQKKFIRKGKPDAGVECLWILENGDELAWQAKFFTSSLDDSQWAQIDKSVKTVLEKHPQIKEYIIAIPIDPADARIEGQRSMLDKWDERVIKWNGWAAEKGLLVNYIPWWSSDLIDRLQKQENAGLLYFWFNKEEFTDEWCKEQTNLSILELGKRYTPNFTPTLNVELEIASIFNGLARDEHFEKQLHNLFDDLIIKGRKAIPKTEEVQSLSNNLHGILDNLYQLFTRVSFRGIESIPYNDFISLTRSIKEVTSKLDSYFHIRENELQEKKNEHRYYHKYGSEIVAIREFFQAIKKFENFITSTTAKLANQPILLLDGDAGIGKSHLFADVIVHRNIEGKSSLFVLGQHMVTDEDPWTQIFKKQNIRCSISEFLGALNSKGEQVGTRFIIFIDAINEGRGKYFWDKNLKSFIQQILNYEWLGVALSIRSSYKELIVPEDDFTKKFIISHTHYGFSNNEYEASKIFFENYGIELPSIPLLHPEFQNPLFLKLFCEGLHKAGKTRIPDGMEGITSIINFYISSINEVLYKPDELSFPRSINVVRKAIEFLINKKLGDELEYIPYESAYVLLDRELLNKYSDKRGLVDALISEGILTKNLFWNTNNEYEEGIYLAYERFEDHLTTATLLDKQEDLKASFSEGGELFYLVKDEYACYQNKGVIEALSIQLPEKAGLELYEVVSHLKDTYPIAEAFVQSLLWRKNETITEKLLEYINGPVVSFKGTDELFWYMMLSVTSTPKHFFNAEFLHRNLMKRKMANRDAWWTVRLKEEFYDESPVKRLIDWGWSSSSKVHISDESIKLTSITLAWFLTSTNRKLRDSATKALVSLLENRINVLIQVLQTFDGVDDPYVYDRLYAVAYGCALRTEQQDMLQELSFVIYEAIFNKEEVYPHVLLRDYARGVIEYTIYLGHHIDIDVAKVRPPYKSTLPEPFPTVEELDSKYMLDTSNGQVKNAFSQNDILESMTTEYGRGVARYGDFGRYVFQSAFRAWDVNVDDLSNLAVEWIFEKYGYNVKLHGEFDSNIGSGRGRGTMPNERIGKKYQWLALYDLLARVSDNFPKHDSWNYEDDVETPFEGPWDPYVRDLDPTMTIKANGGEDKAHKMNWWSKEANIDWDQSNKEWLLNTADLPNAGQLISLVDYNGEEWLTLEGYPEWGEGKKLGEKKWDRPTKRMWYQIRSYLVKSKDYASFKDWAIEQDFMGRWMEESIDKYEIFSREYYWSPAYTYFYKDSIWRSIYDEKRHRFICEAMVTADSFFWEEEFDYSKDETIRFLKPSIPLFEGMGLIYSSREGEFINKSGDLVCFDPKVHHNTKSCLIIKRKPFLEYLKKNSLQIVWTLLGEKNIIGGYSSRDEHLPNLEISGAYYLSSTGEIEGCLVTNSVS